jgi:hypothetical protein
MALERVEWGATDHMIAKTKNQGLKTKNREARLVYASSRRSE